MAFHEGVLFKRDDYLALAWLREAIRNGHATSYYFAGKLLLTADETQLKRNKLFALYSYIGAYQNGAYFLKTDMRRLAEEVRTELGIVLPEIHYLLREDADQAFKDFKRVAVEGAAPGKYDYKP